MTTNTDSTAAGTDYDVVDLGTVTLGKTTYRVEEQRFHSTGGSMTWLYGPRGAAYHLRAFRERGGDSGLRQVISWRSGQPLRQQGNEVLVIRIGDVIERATVR